ncbi:MAG TPA: hypothetical protein VGO47_13205, partial [Chlamydiales bacterium]|nr:hypothetical protein [Chlamydiales bacterium]
WLDLSLFFVQGIPVSRIYCNRETRQAYRLIWRGWFAGIKRATGRRLEMKAFHHSGKHAVFLLDGLAAQVLGLGDNLIMENNPDVSGITGETADEIVKHAVRTCNVHFSRLEALFMHVYLILNCLS